MPQSADSHHALTGTGPLTTIARRARSAIDALPQGRTLPPEVWRTRHRFMLAVVWIHLGALAVAGLFIGQSAGQLSFELGPILACGLAAALPTGSRRLRGSMVAFAALYCSAALVNMAHGSTEAHFHFFVIVSMLAAYEEWVPYLLAIAFVVVHHGLVGVLEPSAVYDHSSAVAAPWKWALIHAAFILGLSVVNVISWRLNENVRAEATDALERTRRSETEFRDAFEDAPIGMAIVDLDGRFERVNASLAQLTGFDAERLLEMHLSDVAPAPPGEPAAADGGSSFEGPLLRADGTSGWGLLQRSVARGAGDEPGHVLVQVLDLTTRKHAEKQLAHAAAHDALTGLANRKWFEEQVDRALAALEAGQSLAVLFVDIDNFKVINDSLGHGAGDRLLVVVAERLRGALAPGDVLARFGGDEFVILLPESDERRALATANLLRADLRHPCDLDGQRRFITASVGLALSHHADAADAATLIRDGDTAMYRAKAAGKDAHVLFDDDLRGEALRRLDLEDGLREALELGKFDLHYQVEVDLHTGATFGVEALIRWRRADGTLMPPDDFIPVAEQSGLIVSIGRWVLDEACRQAAAWRAEGILDDESLMSVNLSQLQLTHGEIVSDVRAALERHDLPARVLCLEITESAIMVDPKRANTTLAELKGIGVKLAIDDFGTGYSSLAHLKQLMPVDIVKIDRTFVQGLLDGVEDAAIITAVIELARKLGLTTIAEGVEGLDQAERLRQMQCAVGQGFGLGRPGIAADVAPLLTRERYSRAA